MEKRTDDVIKDKRPTFSRCLVLSYGNGCVSAHVRGTGIHVAIEMEPEVKEALGPGSCSAPGDKLWWDEMQRMGNAAVKKAKKQWRKL